jgi:hypothetical protein
LARIDCGRESRDQRRYQSIRPRKEKTIPAALEILEGGKVWIGVIYTEDRPLVIDSLKKLHDAGEYPSDLWK